MRILVTTTRMPFTLALIRKLARAGHTMFASDTFDDAPGNHSRFSAHHYVTASPRHATRQFIDDLKKILVEQKIDLLVPCMEEVFYIAHHRQELSELTRVFCSPFETLAQLHHKARFQELCMELGLRVPQTVTVNSQAELRETIERFPHYLARPSFSRGGTTLLTNTGPRAGDMALEQCQPTEENPWLVQEFITGKDTCTYSVARQGKLAAHCTYQTPVQIEDSYGVQFVSVDEPEITRMVSRIVEHTQFEGNISFDFKMTESGPCLIECNPRCTNGALLVPQELLDPAITSEHIPDAPRLTPPGEKCQVGYGMISALAEHKISLPRTLKDFATIRDAYVDRHDLLPALYSFLCFRRFEHLAEHEHAEMMDVMLEDVAWNGAPIA